MPWGGPAAGEGDVVIFLWPEFGWWLVARPRSVSERFFGGGPGGIVQTATMPRGSHAQRKATKKLPSRLWAILRTSCTPVGVPILTVNAFARNARMGFVCTCYESGGSP